MSRRSESVHGPPRSTKLRMLVFLFRGNAGDAVIAERAEQTAAERQGQPVGFGPELYVQVEDSRRERPAQRQEARQLGGCVLRDEQHAGSTRNGGSAPNSSCHNRIDPTGYQFVGDQAHRRGPGPRLRDELEVEGQTSSNGRPNI